MLLKKEIKLGTKVKSSQYGEGTVTEILDLNEPLYFYPYMVKFDVAKVDDYTYSKLIPYDAEGYTPRQHGSDPDGVFSK